jgi:hypothetical protein
MASDREGNHAERKITITVEEPAGAKKPGEAAPTVSQFTFDPNSIQRGQSSALRWDVSGSVNSVTINQGVGTVQHTGNRRVTPNDSATYILTATGPGGTATASTTIGVSAPPVLQSPPLPPCKASTFILDQYGDSRTGQLTWTGTLPARGPLEIQNRRASSGNLRGDILPKGVPVRVSIVPDTIRVTTAPSAVNCWDPKLVLLNSGQTASEIRIRWEVFQP